MDYQMCERHDLKLMDINSDESKGRAMFHFKCKKCAYDFFVDSEYVPSRRGDDGKELRMMVGGGN